MRRTTGVAALLVPLTLVGCGSNGGTPSESPSPGPSGPTATVTGVPTQTPTSTATISPTETPTQTAVACEPFGATSDTTSADPLSMSTLTGARMRVGRHDCYERFVFEVAGAGGPPGWRVHYVDPLTADGSGEPIDLRGDATLEVIVGVWTVTDFAGRPAEWPPFTGPDAIVTSSFVALREARNNYAYEGVTQLGLGLDQERPFRVSWLDDPSRLVVDVYNGVPLAG